MDSTLLTTRPVHSASPAQFQLSHNHKTHAQRCRGDADGDDRGRHFGLRHHIVSKRVADGSGHGADEDQTGVLHLADGERQRAHEREHDLVHGAGIDDELGECRHKVCEVLVAEEDDGVSVHGGDGQDRVDNAVHDRVCDVGDVLLVGMPAITIWVVFVGTVE
ncbi:unnamed protein product [Phytophthora lilii]|uniref:Unnamed protein product n=1 Tax=Phytophthora lilii TaxID=2077276 RepID=A0A9W6XB73_9STRA|nr:unnamed protein product [Phytophthora lilii]